MRTFVVLSMISIDGVMQAPGGPDEDKSGGFKYGGWVAPFDDEVSNELMKKLMRPRDVLLGRKTFEIWENFWPQNERSWPGINDVHKYTLSSTRETSDWNNSIFLKNLDDIRDLKNAQGEEIQIWGSSELVQLLLEHDLVDELWMMIHPIVLGSGKKLFGDSAAAAGFVLVESITTPKGVIIAHYKRGGDVKTGTAGS